ncbi:PLDc N-terminal domain-containing protein [Pseudomonas sp.]|uniref:PLDc N-terminal domain-containing protein n=1 Tax=Pseudomonas sp. TaxID=306 RepID=UPI0028B1EA64|nr:PLDc N-terminal domain-containing protein [Pseudomonas sp.]
MGLTYGAIGAVLLVLHLWAIYQVLGSASARRVKLMWVALIALFPLLGLFNWFVMGPRPQRLAR